MNTTAEKARRSLCSLHGFDSLSQGEEGLKKLFADIQCVQIDPIDPAGMNHDLTLFSRIEDYKKEHLETLLYEENYLFEYYCKMLSMVPMKEYPVFRYEMDRQTEKHADLLDKYGSEIEIMMEKMEEEPLSSLELEDMGEVGKGSWRSKKMSHKLLRALWLSGKIMIHHRKGRRKYYTLAEEVVPREILEKEVPDSEEDYKKRVAEIITKSSKLVSPSRASAQWNRVGGVRETRRILRKLEEEGVVFSLEVDGWKGDLYALEEDKEIWMGPPGSGSSYVRFLAPLDPMLWNRELFAAVFGKEYVWEVYKPKEDRIYGHYCLPILYDDDYVGLIEPYFDDGTLEIRNFHLFDEVDEEGFKNQFEKEIDRYMRFLDAEKVEVKTDHHLVSGM
ncbi:MAG: DNA glycosylase AlkZ-like family protein [Thermoplasmatota archaeon]